jgi:hypothetical protein
MSTIVQMPVRVKPPPAETGEIISPGCASFEIAIPSNGARTTMSARSVRRALRCDCATSTCCCAIAIRALSDSTSASAESSSAREMTLSFTSCCRRPSVSSASLSRASFSVVARFAALSIASSTLSMARSCESSNRARTWPRFTALPSSTKTSSTLPVTFEDTVARRRAVT